jgi:undecaprenyl-diphosphatase
MVAALDRIEEPAVRWVAEAARGPALGACGRWINRLGNGWLYLVVIGIMLATEGAAAWRLIAAAGGAAGLAFVPYYCLKPWLARIRPCDLWPSLGSGVRPLDRFSCPSGHCMTLTAAGTPLAWAHPALIPAILATALLMAWARIALGHHYPSDILLGATLGLAVGLGVSAAFL